MLSYKEMLELGVFDADNDDLVIMNEVHYDAFESVEEIFSSNGKAEGKAFVQKLRNDFKSNCFDVARVIKYLFNKQDYLAEIITFKNGNAFLDGGINVSGNNYTHHTVVLMGEWVIDILHSDKIIKTKDYILELQKHNPKLRIDYTMSTGWYTDDGYLYRPSLDDLIKYKNKLSKI